MSKLFKLLFNRITIVLLLFAVQICFITLVLQEVSEYFVYLNILFRIISFIYCFKLLIKNVSATIKLPIIILLILFPFLRNFLILFFFRKQNEEKICKKFKESDFYS